MSDKLTRAQREQLIFDHLKGKENPLYSVEQTKYGKWIVKPKQIEIEEETVNEEPQEEETVNEPEPVKPTYDRQQAKRERRKRNRHAKQNAKRILDALTNLINSNNGDDDDDSSSDDETPRAPPIVEQNNYNPGPITFKRRRLAF